MRSSWSRVRKLSTPRHLHWQTTAHSSLRSTEGTYQGSCTNKCVWLLVGGARTNSNTHHQVARRALTNIVLQLACSSRCVRSEAPAGADWLRRGVQRHKLTPHPMHHCSERMRNSGGIYRTDYLLW